MCQAPFPADAQRLSLCRINSATQESTSAWVRQKVILSPSATRTNHTTPSMVSWGTVRKIPLSKSMIVSPFLVRVLLFVVCISSLTRFCPSRRKATGVRGTRVCFLYYYYRHFVACFFNVFPFFLYYILIEWFGKYKPYFTKKEKKSHNSCKPLCSIELRHGGQAEPP